MKWFLYAISLIWITFGACAVLYTSQTRNLAKTMVTEVDLKILAVAPAVAGVLFLWAASASRNAWFIRLIGFTAVIKGVFILASPKDLYDKFIDRYLESLTDQVLRLYGIIALILGTAVLSWIL